MDGQRGEGEERWKGRVERKMVSEDGDAAQYVPKAQDIPLYCTSGCGNGGAATSALGKVNARLVE